MSEPSADRVPNPVDGDLPSKGFLRFGSVPARTREARFGLSLINYGVFRRGEGCGEAMAKVWISGGRRSRFGCRWLSRRQALHDDFVLSLNCKQTNVRARVSTVIYLGLMAEEIWACTKLIWPRARKLGPVYLISASFIAFSSFDSYAVHMLLLDDINSIRRLPRLQIAWDCPRGGGRPFTGGRSLALSQRRRAPWNSLSHSIYPHVNSTLGEFDTHQELSDG